MRKNPQFTRKATHKVMFSQDSRKSKGNRKNQNSQSPIRHEILTNKENITPNLMMKSSLSGTKINKAYKAPAHHLNTILEKGQHKQNYRDVYYQIKQQKLNSKINKNQDKNHQYFTDATFNINNLYDYQRNTDLGYSHSQRTDPKPKINIPLKQITISLKNQSIQKCQLNHQQNTPKAVYFVHQSPKNNQKSHLNNFVCCEQCGKNYSQKINLKNFGEQIITKNGLTAKQYYRKLTKKLENLSTCKKNLPLYQQKFKQTMDKQVKIHSKYYSQILQIIEEEMKKSQILIMKVSNQGEQLFKDKISHINNAIFKIQEEILQICQYEENYRKNEKIIISGDQGLFQIEKVNVPAVQLFGNLTNQIHKFRQDFTNNYSFQKLNQQHFSKEQQEQTKTSDKNKEIKKQENKQQEFHNRSEGMFSNYSHKAVVDSKDLDLFCDQDIEDGKVPKRLNTFSFEQKRDFMRIQPEDCILQLVEEEDIISPVFKQI